MFGNFFEGQLCADSCVKFKGKVIPDCEDLGEKIVLHRIKIEARRGTDDNWKYVDRFNAIAYITINYVNVVFLDWTNFFQLPLHRSCQQRWSKSRPCTWHSLNKQQQKTDDDLWKLIFRGQAHFRRMFAAGVFSGKLYLSLIPQPHHPNILNLQVLCDNFVFVLKTLFSMSAKKTLHVQYWFFVCEKWQHTQRRKNQLIKIFNSLSFTIKTMLYSSLKSEA